MNRNSHNPFEDEFQDLQDYPERPPQLGSSSNNDSKASSKGSSIDTNYLVNELQKLSPEEQQKLISLIQKKSEGSGVHTATSTASNKKTSDYMVEDKSSSYSHSHKPEPQKERSYPNHYPPSYSTKPPHQPPPHDDYRQPPQDDYRPQHSGRGRPDRRGKGGHQFQEGGYEKHHDNYSNPREFKKPPQYNEGPQYSRESNYREVNHPGRQVWAGPSYNTGPAPAPAPERKQASKQKSHNNDAILDNVKLREDNKSVMMIFTKIKGQRYLDSLPRDTGDLNSESKAF